MSLIFRKGTLFSKIVYNFVILVKDMKKLRSIFDYIPSLNAQEPEIQFFNGHYSTVATLKGAKDE